MILYSPDFHIVDTLLILLGRRVHLEALANINGTKESVTFFSWRVSDPGVAAISTHRTRPRIMDVE